MFKRSLLAMLFLVAALAPPAMAADPPITRKAKSVQFDSLTTVCSKVRVTNGDKAYIVARCPDNGIFYLALAFPATAPNSGWTIKVHEETPVGQASTDCTYDITCSAVTVGTDMSVSSIFGGGDLTSTPATTHGTGATRKIVTASPTVAIGNAGLGSPGPCATNVCQNADMLCAFNVSATGGGFCDFAAATFSY